MKTLSKYILSSFLVSFISTLFVLTFVMTIGSLFKLSALIANGVPWVPLLKILVMNIPQLLFFTLPISVLVSVLLLFGRLSSDSETTAMQACGISLIRVAVPIWLFSCLLSCVNFYICNWVVPQTHYKTRSTINQLKHVSIDKLIEEGRSVDINDQLSVFVGKKHDKELENIRIFDTSEGFRREIKAKSGKIFTNPDTGKVTIKLYDVRIDPFKKGSPGAAYCDVLPVDVQGNASSAKKYRRKATNYTLEELLAEIKRLIALPPDAPDAAKMRKKCAKLRVELHKRLSMSLSCFVFALIGIPLGIKSHRRETSAGIMISLGLIAFFYIFMSFAKSMSGNPDAHPELIIWIPTVVAVIGAIWLFRRKN